MKLWHWLSLALLFAASLVAGWMVPHDPEHAHWWDRTPGFFAAFGFVGCVLIVFVSKAIGKFLVQRKEDYYDHE